MPQGVYIRQRTQKQLDTWRNNGKIASSQPKTEKQLKALAEGRQRAHGWNKGLTVEDPRIYKAISAMTKVKIGKPRSEATKQKLREKRILRGAIIFGNTIVCHHNDLCHGALRPNDILYMTNSEHLKLHARLQNGLIGKNKIKSSKDKTDLLAMK